GVALAKQPVPLVLSTAPSVSSALYRQLLHRVRELRATKPAAAAALLQQARQQHGCSRKDDALREARLLSRTLAHRSFAGGWEKRCFEGHTGSVLSVSWSPDGRLALSWGGDNAMRLWEIFSGKQLRAFGGHYR